MIAQPPPVGPLSSLIASSTTSVVLVGPHVVTDVRSHVIRIVLEIGGEEADVGQALECVEQRRVPALRRVDDVVVDLDQVRRHRQLEGRAYAFWPMFFSLWTTRIRGSSSDARYSAVPSVDALFQITISRVAGDVREQHVLDVLAQQVHTIVRQNDNGDAAGGRWGLHCAES